MKHVSTYTHEPVIVARLSADYRNYPFLGFGVIYLSNMSTIEIDVHGFDEAGIIHWKCWTIKNTLE